MKIVTVEEMRQVEQTADAAGVTYATMMENAGRAVAEAVAWQVAVEGQRVVLLIGPGNNGGDGLVAAHYLHEMGAKAACYIWKRRVNNDGNFKRVVEDEIPMVWMKDDGDLAKLRHHVQEADVIVDALLGTGASRPIKNALEVLLTTVRASLQERKVKRETLISPTWPLFSSGSALVVAVDLPSGLNADTGDLDPAALPADLTVTFACPKCGQLRFPGAEAVGRLVIADIGVPEELTADIEIELITGEWVRGLLPARPLKAHKGTFGKAMIVAGSVNYTGAPALAAAAATRVGTGLVTLAPPRVLHSTLAAAVAEPTFLLLPHDMGVLAPGGTKILAERLPDYQAILVGPGLTTEKPTVQFVEEFFGQASGEPSRRKRGIGFPAPTREEAEKEAREGLALPPLVVDADALNILSGFEKWWKLVPANSILTPHPGEMDRLVGEELDRDEILADRWAVARRKAAEWNQVVVLKGAFTVVAAPDGRVAVSPFANPGLASGGTGDVLAGAVVGLLAQGLAPFDAAVAGVYLHGLAAEIVRAELGDAGMVASDVASALPEAISLLKQR
jgi:hydroxyethylthiazole kinase-like uncharacterized protein yjeF